MSVDLDEHSEIEIEKLSTEYNALRNEILKRIDLRHQIMSMTLAIAGIFLAVGVTIDTVVLIYPLLVIFLAISWTHNDRNTRRLAAYIRKLERKTPYLGWETQVQKDREERRMGPLSLVLLSHGGTFILTQIMAVIIGILKFGFTPMEWVLLGLDLVAILLVVWIIRKAR